MHNIKFPKNRKSQIAITLNWFFSFLLIFFIMIMFLTAAISISGTKKYVYGWDEITLEKYAGIIKNQRMLLAIFESTVNYNDKDYKIKDMIVKNFLVNDNSDIRTKIKEEVESIIKNNFGDKNCYILYAEDLEANNLIAYGFTKEYKNEWLDNAASVYLISDDKKIKVKFYIGVC